MSNKAILCIDDEVIILESLKEQLKRHFGSQYIYEQAESVQEAWEIIEELQEEKINLLIIISDWLMPNIKGDQFLIEVHKRFPNIIKIMLTGQADQISIDQAKQQANLYACLYKPWTEETLFQVIESALP